MRGLSFTTVRSGVVKDCAGAVAGAEAAAGGADESRADAAAARAWLTVACSSMRSRRFSRRAWVSRMARTSALSSASSDDFAEPEEHEAGVGIWSLRLLTSAEDIEEPE